MGNNLRSACDEILQKVVTVKDRVPGVVAMITDRSANIYEGAAGERILGAGQAMTTDTVFAIYSTTKAITGTAVLQCVEEGKLDLDAPAKNYAPDIGKLEVLDGFDADGTPRLRAPKRDITTRMLMLHTAGLGYDFFNANYNRLAQEHGQPSVITCSTRVGACRATSREMTPPRLQPTSGIGRPVDSTRRWTLPTIARAKPRTLPSFWPSPQPRAS